MSKAVIQGIVSEMADAFLAAGLADAGQYFTPNYPDDGSEVIDCRVFLERAKRPYGDFGSAVASQYQITLLLAEVPIPQRGALVIADSERVRLVKMIDQDDATSIWSVERAPG
jgi:hypothetical protein